MLALDVDIIVCMLLFRSNRVSSILILTAAVYAAPDGAFDWGKLCTFSPIWQWAAEWRERALWNFWKCITGWHI